MVAKPPGEPDKIQAVHDPGSAHLGDQLRFVFGHIPELPEPQAHGLAFAVTHLVVHPGHVGHQARGQTDFPGFGVGDRQGASLLLQLRRQLEVNRVLDEILDPVLA